MARKDGEMKVAILVDSGFEEEELLGHLSFLQEAGIQSDIISPSQGTIRGWHDAGWGKNLKVDVSLADARPDSYDVVVIPGAIMNPQTLRRDRRAEAFVGSFFASGKPVAALCRGPWDLIHNAAQKQCSTHNYRSVRTNVGALVTRLKKTADPETTDAEFTSFSDDPPGPDLRSHAARRQVIMWVSDRHVDH